MPSALGGNDPRPTRSQAVIGTASYMSPEQAAGKTREVGKAADIYGLGAILFELLTGRPPFLAESFALTVVQVLNEDPPRPTELVPSLPADLEAICLKCLEKDPAQRFASASELADELRCWLDGMPTRVGQMHVLDRDARWAHKIGYEITDLLGCTRWAFIYNAVQTNINRKVLLKLSTGRVGSPQHVALKRQASALAGLDHPNIVRLITYGEQYGQPYLILEHIEGGTALSRLIRDASLAVEGPDRLLAETTRKPLSPRRAAEICLMIALGLQEIHQHRELHTGLHTGAIVMTRDGVAKITGFDSARTISEPISGELAPAPESVPPAFVAPELFAGHASRIGPETDIYGLGAILYELLTGVPPFLAATIAETRKRILHDQPNSPSRIEPGVPSALEVICLKCLDKRPSRRYRKATDLQLALQQFLRPPASPDGDTTVEPTDLPPPSSGGAATVYQLRIVRGTALVGTTFALQRQTFLIGRSEECQIILPGTMISRPHCRVVWNEETCQHEIVDMSKNGSFVNEKKVITSRPLAPGDRIRVHDFEFKYELVPTQDEAK